MPFGGLIRRGTSSFFNNAGKPNGATTKETLFPLVSKEVDGDDCDHDCEGCPGYGRAFEKIGIETKMELWGGIKGYANHIVVATGETDWIRDVEDIKGSVMEALSKKSGMLENGRLMISASNLHPPLDYHTATEEEKPQPTTVLLLPSFTVVENVTPNDMPELISCFINPSPTTSTPLDPPPPTPITPASLDVLTPTNTSATEPGPEGRPLDESFTTLSLAPSSALKSHPYPHSHLILICSHRRRDARCGISAPILRKEFEKHLRPLGLWRDLTDNREGGTKVVFINHVGGHKFSANVIIYRREDGQGIWLARVAPKHVEGIVKYTVLQGKVVHGDMIRGGFNRRSGATSW